MARGRQQSTTYATAPYGQADAAFAALMAEILVMDARADVRRSAAIVALFALTLCWPSEHFPKRDRDRWTHRATAAFRVSERELAEPAGFSRPRVHNALKALLDAGYVVELAPARPRGEGRGTAPATYAFRCHLAAQSVSHKAVSSEAPDPPQPAQAWHIT